MISLNILALTWDLLLYEVAICKIHPKGAYLFLDADAAKRDQT